ncbi:ATP-dependent helicase HrpB [Paenibacillus phyllosphaerae]|uniref:ATP-dependent helicase HrpB n=1 Tax=Paenibacillus phyllosphaerae TaxID=274593 RepID=A0A7W5FLT4_9BACL|nr:ATP-dependent helicase HrpB [Paenibacillus phyllosphaerae]MBB3109496.1 ATP-dependent helicase HrpB [Paenibacillus phyllosphaerae]
MNRLPIDEVLPELAQVLQATSNAVLVAAPGAGKTTRIPLALLGEHWLDSQRILMLEPRRIAARSAARFMAASIGEQAGGTVGYRVRMDTKVGPSTRIEVVTEGVLTRMLQHDPALEGVGLVIFDEFHERHLNSDLGLALCLQTQALFREDLRILVMSATIEAEPIAELLGGAPVTISEGRAYPVDTIYQAVRQEGRLEEAVVPALLEAIAKHEGDILVFLPGAGEIRRVQGRLASAGLPAGVDVTPLYGGMPAEAQDKAVSAAEQGRRKIVLATSIAESSVTVRGVRIVIDGGLSRVPKFSPRTGMARLETVPVSVASADQRRGRAGREAPGVCYRLWTEEQHRQLPPQSEPEIRAADMAPLALELAVWGIADPSELEWLDAPPAAAYGQATQLLAELGATEPGAPGTPTSHGRAMAELGMHPRLSHMVMKATELGLGGAACELAALLSDRDPLRTRSVDMRLRLAALQGNSKEEGDEAALRRMAEESRQWKQALGLPTGKSSRESAESCGLLLAFAYPDRIAQRRPDGRFLLSGGRGAAIAELQPLSGAAFLVAAELDDTGTDSRIRLAAPIALEELHAHCAQLIQEETEVRWDRGAEAVRARRRTRLGSLVLREGPLPDPDPALVMAALFHGLREQGLGLLPWTKPARQLQARALLMRKHNASWPDLSEEGLLDSLEAWLAPYVSGIRSRSELGKLNMTSIIENLLSWQERQQLESEVPTHLTVPSGSRIPVDYSDPDSPFLAVRLQELFGLTATPRIAGGKLPVTLHLLSPAHRPVQVTRDLASFWQDAYFEVKKDLKGRYPKHYWPDNPLEAAPTNRAKPRQH